MMGFLKKIAKWLLPVSKGPGGVAVISTGFGKIVPRWRYMQIAATLLDLKPYGYEPTELDYELNRRPIFPFVPLKRFELCVERIRQIDPQILKPTEKERGRHIQMVKKASWLIDCLEEGGFHPFLNCGTLLGAVRHNALIPWDDDVDIDIMRDEYPRAVEYLTGKLKYIDAGHVTSWKEFFAFIAQAFQKGEVSERGTMFTCSGHMKIFFGTTLRDAFLIDLEVMDYYPNDMDEESFIQRRNVMVEMLQAHQNATWADINKEVERMALESRCAVPESDTVYFGMQHYYFWERFRGVLMRDDIFPTKKLKMYEWDFPVPNHAETVLQRTYGKNYMAPPLQLTLGRHDFSQFQ